MKPVYAMLGNDEASKHVRIEALKDAFARAYGELTVEVYDAATASPATVLGSLMTSSLLSGNRIVLVRSFDAWASSSKAATEQAVMALAMDYLTDPDRGTVLLLVGGRMPKKTKAWKALAAAINAHAGEKGKSLLEYNMPPEWDMYKWVMTLAASDPICLSLDRPVAEHLVAVAGTDSMTIYNELLKIGSYLDGKKQVSRGDIDILVMPRPHLSEYRFSESMSEGKAGEAFRVLEHLGDKSPTQLVHVLSREVRMMTELSALMRSGATNAKMKSTLKERGYLRAEPTDFMLEKFKRRAALYDEERCVRAIRLLSEMDFGLKGGNRGKYDDAYLVERLVSEMAPRAGR